MPRRTRTRIRLDRLLTITGHQLGSNPNLSKTIANGVELHYMEHGSGTPLVLVHSSLADYREWDPQIERFTAHFRAIRYSRRYNFPNVDNALLPDYSALIDAADLAALVENLGIAPVHLVGYSYGAFAALAFALDHPGAVRSLVVAEPPLHRWVLELPDGERLFDAFMNSFWNRVADAFRRGDKQAALEITAEFFVGPDGIGLLPPELLQLWEDNLPEWEALTCSSDAFPNISRRDIQKLKAPTLLLSGENTLPIHRRVNDELESRIAGINRIRIPGATHAMWDEQPGRCGEAVLAFLEQ